MKNSPKVGECAWCGHWGLLWGRWCKHPWKNKATECKLRWHRWVYAKNKVADPLPDDDWTSVRWHRRGYSWWGGVGDECGRRRKVHMHE